MSVIYLHLLLLFLSLSQPSCQGRIISVHRTNAKVCYTLGIVSLSTTCGVHKVHRALLVAQTEGLGWCYSPKYFVGVCWTAGQ